MYGGPRPRRPIKVVVMVLVFWVLGNIAQAGFGWLFVNGGLVSPDSANLASLVPAWGLLFAVAYYYREPFDDWLRS
jgi:hypothetical protein